MHKIKIKSYFTWLKVNKSDTIKGLQNSAEDCLIYIFFQVNNRIPSKQALYLLTLGEMGGALGEALGAQDSQGEMQHDLSALFGIHKC